MLTVSLGKSPFVSWQMQLFSCISFNTISLQCIIYWVDLRCHHTTVCWHIKTFPFWQQPWPNTVFKWQGFEIPLKRMSQRLLNILRTLNETDGGGWRSEEAREKPFSYFPFVIGAVIVVQREISFICSAVLLIDLWPFRSESHRSDDPSTMSTFGFRGPLWLHFSAKAVQGNRLYRVRAQISSG